MRADRVSAVAVKALTGAAVAAGCAFMAGFWIWAAVVAVPFAAVELAVDLVS